MPTTATLSGSVTATSAATAQDALPTGLTGSAAQYQSTHGELNTRLSVGGVLVGPSAPLPIAPGSNVTFPVTPVTSSFTDRSGSVSTGGTSQTLAAVNTSRKRLVIQNPCTATSQGIATAEDLFINFTSAASVTAASFELQPCGSYDTAIGPLTTEAVTVVSATTGHKFTAKEQ